jgi:hypothetical protein
MIDVPLQVHEYTFTKGNEIKLARPLDLTWRSVVYVHDISSMLITPGTELLLSE